MVSESMEMGATSPINKYSILSFQRKRYGIEKPPQEEVESEKL